MKAATIDTYGAPEVLVVKDIPKPTIGDGDILVRVKAVAVTAADSRIRGARFPKGFGFFARLAFGITKPRIKVLGNTYSGVIEEVGKNVNQFKVGDEVCGMTGVSMGTYAEYIKISKLGSVAKKPVGVTHEDAAGLLFGGTAALYFLRDKLAIKEGDEVLVNGASGAIGTNAVQLAKYFGAKVTGVTSSPNAQLVTSLGAEQVIDYTKQSVAKSDRKFDIVLDAVGNISPAIAKTLLTSNGRAGLVVAGLGDMLKAHGQIKVGTSTEKKEDIEYLLSLVEQGKIKVVIDKLCTLDEIVDAHTHVDTGRKVGNVVVTI